MTGAEFGRLTAVLGERGLSDDQIAEALGLTGKNRARRIREWKGKNPPDWVGAKMKEIARANH